MAKQKYLTEYPAILKEKAKNAGVKIKKADCRFLEYFMFIQEEAEYIENKLELMEESEEVVIDFTTHMGETIHMMKDAPDAVLKVGRQDEAMYYRSEFAKIGAQAEIA